MRQGLEEAGGDLGIDMDIGHLETLMPGYSRGGSSKSGLSWLEVARVASMAEGGCFTGLAEEVMNGVVRGLTGSWSWSWPWLWL